MPAPWSRGLDRLLRSPLAAVLTAPHGVERFLEQCDPLWSVDRVKARVVRVERTAADTVVLGLRPNRHWAGFVAGQYLRVGVEVNGVWLTRCYSLSNAPADGELEIAVKRQGRVSQALFDAAQVGQLLMLSQAEGDFALPVDSPSSLLMIAGGSGITPIMAMLRKLHADALRGAHPPRVSLRYYVQRRDQAVFADALRAMGECHPDWDLRILATREGGERFGVDTLRGLQEPHAQSPIYVCGPVALIEAVTAARAELGWNGRVLSERFTADAFAPSGRAEGELRFARSERFVPNDGRSLLDQAEAAGLRPDAGCRMGICHSCLCRKTGGRVRDLRNGQLSDDGEQHIQLCVSVAEGDVTLDL